MYFFILAAIFLIILLRKVETNNNTNNKPMTSNKNTALYYNNPSGLISPDAWKGSTGQAPQGWVKFVNLEMGIRATALNFRNAYWRRGKKNVKEIVTTWCGYYHTNYVNFVADKLGLSPNVELNASDIPRLLNAIMHFESGVPVSTDQDIKLILQKYGISF